jgi:hypothetical protein
MSLERAEKVAFGYGSDAPIFRQFVRFIVTIQLFLGPSS